MDFAKDTILDRLGSNRFATVTELSSLLGVSTVTVRRYLDLLEKEGLVRRTRGGAFMNEGLVEEPSFGSKQVRFIAEKQRIAQAAVATVQDGDTIALNAGTTTWEIARCLRSRQNLTVVTNSISIASVLVDSPGIRLVVTGGILRERSQALVGPIAEAALRGIFVSKAFLGVNGISLSHGLTTPNMEEAQINRVLMRVAQSVTIVADHSKFERVSFSLIASVSEIGGVITDKGTPDEIIRALQAMEKEVTVV
ncbi:MAG TPA: DeoR/GlpR family DNA-binding transcription regulator [Symbiobacteriaceae bacterium]|nr:DeoR/GlpR family DNA-binding transcription regulator [Symbiobacteriaceae bacterium]